MQSVFSKVTLLSILLALCVQAQGLPFYFDPMGNIGGASFTPLSIPNCGLWLDASDTSTVQLSGVSVTNWLNKAVQGDSARVIGATNTYPSFCSAELNGKCTVYFDGADYLKSSFLSSTGTTVFVVAKLVSGEAIMGARDSVNSRSYWGARSFEKYVGAGVGNVSAVQSTNRAWSSDYILFAGGHTGSSVFIRADGAGLLITNQVGTGANFVEPYFVGGFNNIGEFAAPSTVYVAELIAYNSALSTEAISMVETYLRAKWFGY